MATVCEDYKDTKEGREALERLKTHFDGLGSKHYLSAVVHNLSITKIDIFNDIQMLNILDCLIHKLTNKLLLFQEIKDSKYYSLAKQENKHLLVHGYIGHFALNTYNHIPSDIIDFIFRFYDNTIVWRIENEHMDKVRNAINEEYVQGPKFSVKSAINAPEITADLRLTTYDHKDISYTKLNTLWLTLQDFPENIEVIVLSISLFQKETGSMEQRVTRVMPHNHDYKKFTVDALVVGFDNLIKYDSLTMECTIDILYVIHKDNIPLIMSKLPMIDDTKFIWNIDDELMKKLKCMKNGQLLQFYSDSFCNDTMALLLSPHFPYHREEQPDTVQLALELLKIPFGVESITMNVNFTTYCDNVEINTNGTYEYKFNFDRKCCVHWPFSSILLKSMKVLSFVVDIKIIGFQCSIS